MGFFETIRQVKRCKLLWVRYRYLVGKAAFLVGLFLFVAVLPAVVFGRTPPSWVPEPLRNWAFDVRLTVAPPIKKISSVAQGSVQDINAYVDNYGRNVKIQSQGLTITGTLYEPDAAGERPAILLLHGSTPEGRKLGLYRVLGKGLADRGYVVFTIDRRGYGDSDDPPLVDGL
jgi:acetyl esterase/lipase